MSRKPNERGLFAGNSERCLAGEADTVGTINGYFARPWDEAPSVGAPRRWVLRTVHPLRMPLNRRCCFKQCRSCNRRLFKPIIGFVIPRKFWLPAVILASAMIAIFGLSVSGCTFADDNVGSVNGPTAAPVNTPQVPESMKTNDFGQGGNDGPPQGIY